MRGATSDVIERKRAEAALIASELRYRRLFESARDGILILDADTGAVLDVNPFLVELLGFPRETFLGMKLWDLGLFRDFIANHDSFAELKRAEYVRYDDKPLQSKDGRLVNVEFISNVYRVDGHKVIQCSIRDISERRRAEASLRERENLLSEAQRLGHVGSWFWDMTGPISWSEETFRIYGVSPDTFTPTTEALLGLIHPDDRSAMQSWMAACAAGEKPTELEFRINRPDGTTRTLLGRGEVAPGVGNRPIHMAGTAQDITERKQAEAEKATLEAQLQQAQKMESVGRLAGGVAHDFNNMLSVILGHAELALAQVRLGQPLYADLTEIRRAAVRSAALTRQLLAFARKQTAAPKVLNLNETVADVLSMLHRLIGENIDLRWLPAADLWPVNMDPSQIDQILTNLCVNAQDAISGVGKMTIETSNSTLDKRYCAAHVGCVPGEYVRLAVSDDGCGMDKDTLSHLFEPFFTTKAAGDGTGLGLATVYGVVKQNNGFINVYSEPNHGTTFTIYLPRHVGKAGQARAEGAARPVLRGHETILLVEDEPAILTLTKRMLEHQGYTVVAASTPGQALHLAKEHTGEIHLVMTDVVMPEMNGRVLAKNLMSVHPLVKRLFMSGYTADVIAHQGVLDAGVHFIQKPFSTDDLAAKVREALDAPS